MHTKVQSGTRQNKTVGINIEARPCEMSLRNRGYMGCHLSRGSGGLSQGLFILWPSEDQPYGTLDVPDVLSPANKSDC